MINTLVDLSLLASRLLFLALQCTRGKLLAR